MQDNVLALLGLHIDTISGLTVPWDFDIAGGNSKNLTPITAYVDNVNSLIVESNAKGTDIYRNPLDRQTAFYRIPVADQEMYGMGFRHSATEASRVGHEHVRNDLAAGEVLKETNGTEK
jgi:hypothetical protein